MNQQMLGVMAYVAAASLGGGCSSGAPPPGDHTCTGTTHTQDRLQHPGLRGQVCALQWCRE